jgi:hypothetical protein
MYVAQLPIPGLGAPSVHGAPPNICHSLKSWLLAFGFWLLAFGYWLLAFGYWLLAIGFWLLAFGYWLARVIKSDKEVVCFA